MKVGLSIQLNCRPTGLKTVCFSFSSVFSKLYVLRSYWAYKIIRESKIQHLLFIRWNELMSEISRSAKMTLGIKHSYFAPVSKWF